MGKLEEGDCSELNGSQGILGTCRGGQHLVQSRVDATAEGDSPKRIRGKVANPGQKREGVENTEERTIRRACDPENGTRGGWKGSEYIIGRSFCPNQKGKKNEKNRANQREAVTGVS